MRIRSIFESVDDINLTDYLKHFNIDRPKEFINGQSEFDFENYRLNACLIQMFHMKNESKHVFVLVDPDGDGYCASAIIMKTFSDWNITPVFHSKKQHGVDQEIIDKVESISHKEPALLIIPDASIDNKWQDALDECNIKTVVIDHHPVEAKVNDLRVPNIHHYTNNMDTPQSGSMFTFKLAYNYRKQDPKIFKQIMELGCLGNYTDVMPQNYLETRAFNVFTKEPKHKFIKAMLNKFSDKEVLCPAAVAWGIGPKINAVIRSTNQELKEKLFHALWSEEFDVKLLDELDKNHLNQKSYVRSIVKDKLQYDKNNNVIIVHTPKDDNVVGLNGLLANRIMMLHNRPTIAVTYDEETKMYRGSLRSPVDLKTIFQDSGLFAKAQGHERACGIDFEEANEQKIIDTFNAMELQEDITEVAISLEHDEFNEKMFRVLDSAKEYWGEGIPKPLIHIKPFTINLANFKFTNKFKSDVKMDMKPSGTYYDIVRTFISKVNREKWQLGKKQFATIEMIGTIGYNASGRRVFDVEDWEINPIEYSAF